MWLMNDSIDAVVMGWNIAATVLVGLSRALETRRWAKVNLCENIARTQFHKDSWGDGITLHHHVSVDCRH